MKLPIDVQLCEETVVRHMRVYGESTPDGTPDMAGEALSGLVAFDDANDAGVSAELAFATGVEFGIRLAIATINSPFNLDRTAFDSACVEAQGELDAHVATILADAKLVAVV